MSKIAIILVLPLEYNTSSMLRCRSIITALAERGHTLKCYCPNPDKNSKYYDQDYDTIPNVEVYRFKKTVIKNEGNSRVANKSIKSLIKKMMLEVFHKIDVFGSTLLYLPEKRRISDDISKGNFDILLSFSDPMPAHMIGKYCKKNNPGLKYIQQWGDPLASDTISKTAQPVWIRKLIEESLLKTADRICYVSPFTCDKQKMIFHKQANKMFFLPTPSLRYSDEPIETEGLSLGYFGSYNSIARNIKPFYEAAKRSKNVRFFIIGDSDVILESTDNITVINRISPEELGNYMKKINVIVCLMNLKGNQIPGKVYHDASSSKDILLIKDGEYGDEIERFFKKYQHYTFVNNNVDSIENAIRKYSEEGVPMRKPVDDFRASNVASRLIKDGLH